MQITKQLRTETGHRLTNYNGRCAHLHGHSYLWEVTARCSDEHLDAKNMVMDFKDLKKAMNAVLDPLDHCMVLAPDDPLVKVSGEVMPLEELFTATNGDVPRLIVWHNNPTAESFAQWALEEIERELTKLWQVEQNAIAEDCASMPYYISSVKVWETATSYAEASSGGVR